MRTPAHTKFDTVEALLRETCPEVVEDFLRYTKGRRVAKDLQINRLKSKSSLEGLANTLDWSLSRLHKFEMSQDSELTLGDIIDYSAAIKVPVVLKLGDTEYKLS